MSASATQEIQTKTYAGNPNAKYTLFIEKVEQGNAFTIKYDSLENTRDKNSLMDIVDEHKQRQYKLAVCFDKIDEIDSKMWSLHIDPKTFQKFKPKISETIEKLQKKLLKRQKRRQKLNNPNNLIDTNSYPSGIIYSRESDGEEELADIQQSSSVPSAALSYPASGSSSNRNSLISKLSNLSLGIMMSPEDRDRQLINDKHKSFHDFLKYKVNIEKLAISKEYISIVKASIGDYMKHKIEHPNIRDSVAAIMATLEAETVEGVDTLFNEFIMFRLDQNALSLCTSYNDVLYDPTSNIDIMSHFIAKTGLSHVLYFNSLHAVVGDNKIPQFYIENIPIDIEDIKFLETVNAPITKYATAEPSTPKIARINFAKWGSSPYNFMMSPGNASPQVFSSPLMPEMSRQSSEGMPSIGEFPQYLPSLTRVSSAVSRSGTPKQKRNALETEVYNFMRGIGSNKNFELWDIISNPEFKKSVITLIIPVLTQKEESSGTHANFLVIRQNQFFFIDPHFESVREADVTRPVINELYRFFEANLYPDNPESDEEPSASDEEPTHPSNSSSNNHIHWNDTSSYDGIKLQEDDSLCQSWAVYILQLVIANPDLPFREIMSYFNGTDNFFRRDLLTLFLFYKYLNFPNEYKRKGVIDAATVKPIFDGNDMEIDTLILAPSKTSGFVTIPDKNVPNFSDSFSSSFTNSEYSSSFFNDYITAELISKLLTGREDKQNMSFTASFIKRIDGGTEFNVVSVNFYISLASIHITAKILESDIPLFDTYILMANCPDVYNSEKPINRDLSFKLVHNDMRRRIDKFTQDDWNRIMANKPVKPSLTILLGSTLDNEKICNNNALTLSNSIKIKENSRIQIQLKKAERNVASASSSAAPNISQLEKYLEKSKINVDCKMIKPDPVSRQVPEKGVYEVTRDMSLCLTIFSLYYPDVKIEDVHITINETFHYRGVVRPIASINSEKFRDRDAQKYEDEYSEDEYEEYEGGYTPDNQYSSSDEYEEYRGGYTEPVDRDLYNYDDDYESKEQ